MHSLESLSRLNIICSTRPGKWDAAKHLLQAVCICSTVLELQQPELCCGSVMKLCFWVSGWNIHQYWIKDKNILFCLSCLNNSGKCLEHKEERNRENSKRNLQNYSAKTYSVFANVCSPFLSVSPLLEHCGGLRWWTLIHLSVRIVRIHFGLVVFTSHNLNWDDSFC